MLEEMVVNRLRELDSDPVSGDAVVGPAYLAQVLERVCYDSIANRLRLRLRRAVSNIQMNKEILPNV